MDLTFFVSTLALIPYFTSRAFIPLFATSVVARFGAEWTLVAGLLDIELLDQAPAWALSDTMLMVLGGLALAEAVATKSQTLREVLSTTDAEVKALLVTGLVVVLAGGEALAAGQAPAPLTASAGFDLAALTPAAAWGLVVGAATWLLATIRRGIYAFLQEIDDDDDLGLQGLLAWLEDLIGFAGVLFALILPGLALVVAGLAALSLWAARALIRRRERRQRLPCPTCGEPLPGCALLCGSCRHPYPEPRAVGWLGLIRQRPAPEPVRHRFDLRAVRRCRDCGERLGRATLEQRCATCRLPAFDSQADLEAYLARLRATLPRTVGVLFLFGLVPVLGLFPGILYYRLTLIASLRGYLPRGSRFLGRWGIRLLNLVLILLQSVPVIGAFTLPAMALSNFYIYQRLVRRQARRSWQAAPAPA